jgi:nucleotide-binding universal stress UspA family protein
MENDCKLDGRPEPGAPQHVLVAVHGREPAGWEVEVCRALALSPRAAVRVLAVTDIPSPPSATLLPAARRARARAHAEWRRIELITVGRRVETLLSVLPMVPDIAWAHVEDADPGGAIVERAAVWGADLIVVGVDGASWLERRLLGAIHERVVDRAGCSVLVTPSPARSTIRHWDGASAAGLGGQHPAAAKGGA